MTNRRFTLMTLTAIAFAAFLLPANASAQSIWERMRERAREASTQRGRDDDYNRRSGRISDYDRRTLRDTARRLSSRARDLQRNVDRLLDNRRQNGTRREDRVNQDVQNFRNAAERFRDRAGDSNDYDRGAGEARQLLESASRVNQYLSRLRLDSRTASDWAQIRNDLRTIADIYNLRFRDFDGYGRNDDYGRDRRRDNNSRWPY